MDSERLWSLGKAMDPPSFGSIGEVQIHSSEEAENQSGENSKKRSTVKTALVGILAVFLVAACFIAAYVGAESMDGNNGPSIELHGFLSYFGFDAESDDMMCLAEPTSDDIPRWDPDFMEEPGWDTEGTGASGSFYNACYRAFRCCSSSSSSCNLSDNFGAKCRDCIAQNGPRIVKAPCERWLDECVTGENEDYSTNPQCLATGGSGEAIKGDLWDKEDLMDDNGVPSSSVPAWHVQWVHMLDGAKEIGTCWKQKTDRAPATNPDVQAFAHKCWEVLSYCHQETKVCPRDESKTKGHEYCKNCMLVGYDAHTKAPDE
jgi:hypothetical protein